MGRAPIQTVIPCHVISIIILLLLLYLVRKIRSCSGLKKKLSE